MHCSQCDGIETIFNQKKAVKDLREYRRKGPVATTRLLLEGLKAEGVEGLTLLDIGGGVGAIPNELLRAGVSEASDVDASAAFIAAAKEEAALQSHSDRIHFYYGDFINLAPEIPPADIVTLDRVICCYHDMDSLVGLSSARARKLYGVVFPRDTWWLKIGLRLGNLICRIQRNPFRSYAHPTREVEAKAQSNGLKRHYYRQTFLWQVVVYARESET
ncbi:MAG: methyltransferase domain-containing protein [Anaerolineae bacterium]|nr:methyltransferase domain-containing protein [Anaerolineae bacterium]